MILTPMMMNETRLSLKRLAPSSVALPAKKRIRRIVASLPQRLTEDKDKNDIPTKHDVSPQEFLMAAFKSKGSVVTVSPSLAVQGFFADPTEVEISAYNHDVISAIRSHDIENLREFHESGRTLKCSNAFGESLLHLACRRSPEVAAFLIQEAGVTLRVRDDYGRTPLHDACWTAEPNFELLGLIMTACPALLFMKDQRGNTPLDYTRKEYWGAYTKFLCGRMDLLFASQCHLELKRQV